MSEPNREPRNNAATTRGRPFTKGNRGRPKGARHRVTIAVEALMQGEAEALTRKAIERALAGDMMALKLCLDRIAPPRKDPTASFDLPKIESAADLPVALAAVLAAVSTGELSPDEGKTVADLVEAARRGFETADLAERVAALEARDGP